MVKKTKSIRGRQVELEASIEFSVDDYLRYATDDALLMEVIERGLDFEPENSTLTKNEIIEIVVQRLNIIEAERVRAYLEFKIPNISQH